LLGHDFVKKKANVKTFNYKPVIHFYVVNNFVLIVIYITFVA